MRRDGLIFVTTIPEYVNTQPRGKVQLVLKYFVKSGPECSICSQAAGVSGQDLVFKLVGHLDIWVKE